MKGGYLQRVVDSGTTPLREVRRSMGGPSSREDFEEPLAAPPAPFADDHAETGVEPLLSERPAARFAAAPGEDAITSPASAPIARGGDAARAGGVTPVPGAAPDRQGPGADRGLRVEPRRTDVDSAATRGETAPRPPSLRDAGVRSVLPRETMAVRGSARREQRPVAFDAPAHPFGSGGNGGPVRTEAPAGDSGSPSRRDVPERTGGDVPSRTSHPRVAAGQVEEWQRLRDRLLLEHFPGAATADVAPPAAGGGSQAADGRSAASGREIVIDQLEVVIAAPQAPAPAAPSGLRHRSGAWSVAARRYLGKL